MWAFPVAQPIKDVRLQSAFLGIALQVIALQVIARQVIALQVIARQVIALQVITLQVIARWAHCMRMLTFVTFLVMS